MSTLRAGDARVERALEDALHPPRGRLSLGARTFPDGMRLAIDGDHVGPVASVVKWPLRVAYEDAVARGEVDPSTHVTVRPAEVPGGTGILERMTLPRAVKLADAADLMVMVSDNLACNLVIDALGGVDDADVRITKRVGRGVRLRGRATFGPEGEVASMGEASAAGLLDFLDGLVTRRWPGSDATWRAAERTLDRSMLPRYLPDPVLGRGGPAVAHKSGLVPGVRADAGLLRSGGRILAIAVLTEGVDDGGFSYENTAERRIGRIAALLAHRHLGVPLAPEALAEEPSGAA